MTRDEALERFRLFCIAPIDDPTNLLEEVHWHDMSVGFFLALGLGLDAAWVLAREARYTHHYWQPHE